MTEPGGSLFLFGASGHAKVVIDAVERAGSSRILFVCDDAPDKHGGTLMGYPVIGGREALLARARECSVGVVSIGDNTIRARLAEWLLANGCTLATVLHPAAVVARQVEIGAGSVVMAGCIINSGTKLGSNVILNTSASVDHDCTIGDGVHIAPGTRLCGGVEIGSGTLIGAGTTIIPGVRVGKGALVGAGSTVLKDLPDGARAGGNPCRLLT